MELLPSTLILHKCADGADTRLASLRSPLVTNPLEKWLGALDNGPYRQAPPESNWAFERLDDMWAENEVKPPADTNPGEEDPEENSEDSDSTTSGDDSDQDPTRNTNPIDTPRRARNTNHDTTATNDRPSDQSATNQTATTVSATSPRDLTHTRAQTRARGRSDRKLLRNLYDAIMKSVNKLVFVRHRLPTDDRPRWYLVQIDLDATNPQLAKTMGTYSARWLTPHHVDRRHKPLTDCRFWPDICRRPTPTEPPSREPIPTSPAKAEELVRNDPTAAWIEDDVNLATDRLVGPFEFQPSPDRTTTRQKTTKFAQVVDLTHWDQLVIACQRVDLDASDVDTIPPRK